MKRLLSDIFKDIITGCNNLIAATLSKQDTAKETACNRLKLVLMHDRTKLDPSTLERMRDELVEVISRYVEIDQELLDLNLASEGNSIALVASIPVIRAKQIEDSKNENEETVEPESSLEEVLETEVVELDDDDDLDDESEETEEASTEEVQSETDEEVDVEQETCETNEEETSASEEEGSTDSKVCKTTK